MRKIAWFKVDDGLHSSRKFLSIPKRARFAAVGLWTVAGSWCADELTDGHVPNYMLDVWGAPPSAPQSLVDAGLWERESGGYLFCNWLEYQPRKADVDAEREASRERMRDLRARRKQKKAQNDAEVGEVFGRTPPNGSENVRNPDPTRPDPTPSSSKDSEGGATPPRKCRRHSHWEHEENCRTCMADRRAATEWEVEQAQRALERKRAEAEAARRVCAHGLPTGTDCPGCEADA